MEPDNFDTDRLIPEAMDDYIDFVTGCGNSGCSCFINPPCPYCTHPGNPANLMEDETAWFHLTKV